MPEDKKFYPAAAEANYYAEEFERAIRRMKIEGATLEESVAAIDDLANRLRAMADQLPTNWPTLLEGTVYAR